MNLQKQFQSLGFDKNEAAVYVALVKKGLSPAGELVKATKLHRMLVYNALERLAEEGLVTITRKKAVRLFQTSSPLVLKDKARRIQEVTNEAVREIERLQKNTEQIVSVRTLAGHEGFIRNLADIVESCTRQNDRTMRIIGGARDKDFYNAAGDWYGDYVSLLEKKRIAKHLLAPESYSEEFKRKFASEARTELRTMSKELRSPTYTRITKEMVSIEIYSPSLLVIQIHNADVARGYLDFFQLLWNLGKPFRHQ